jgi:hypothetical protein
MGVKVVVFVIIYNVYYVPYMYQYALDVGYACFVYFNFKSIGRVN